VHPLTAALVGLLRSGAIGRPRLIRAAFGSAKPFDPASRQYDPALGGGGILDVGCYPVSIARLVAGAAANRPFAEPVGLTASGHLGRSGVDEWAVATLEFPGRLYAQLATGVAVAMDNTPRIDGEHGHVHVPSPWWCSGREGGRGVITVQSRGETIEHVVETADWLYAIEADAVARHLPGRQVPAMSWDDTLGNMRTLDAWRAAIGLSYPGERDGACA
jgi:predicted dehydrogenase